MGDDITVRRLVEILSAFYVDKKPVEEDLTYSLTNEFLQNIQNVLLTKQSVILHRWKNFLHVCGNKMLSSIVMYLRYVVYTCRLELTFNYNIFEKFLGVFALVIYINVETLKRIEVNFCKFIPDIFMVFYSHELKKTFGKRGGFHQFAKYVNNPDYISLKSSSKYISSFCDSTTSVDVLPNDLAQQMERVSHDENDLLKKILLEAKKDWPSVIMAQNIVNSTKIMLSILPSSADMKKKLSNLAQEEIAQLAGAKRELEALDEFLQRSSNSYSKTSEVIGQMADKAQYEDIVEAVIKYNRSINSSHEKSNNRLQEKSCEILEHLKGNIVSFIEVLDEYDNE